MNYIIHKSVRLLWLTGVRGVSSTQTNTNYSWLELVWQSKMLHCISVKHLWKTSATFRHCLTGGVRCVRCTWFLVSSTVKIHIYVCIEVSQSFGN